MQSKNSSHVLGVDVSHHQGMIDWKKVAAAGMKYAYVKATEGRTYTDPQFEKNAAGAVAAGLVVGFYHYARPENNAPEDEADNFYRATLGHPYRLPLVLDVEGQSSGLGKAKLTVWCKTFLEELQKLSGADCMIYTGGSFAKSYLGAELAKWPLWVAHYGVDTPMSNPTWSKWSVFQYTSSGSIAGISGNVDLNAAEPAFLAKYGKPAAPYKPSAMPALAVQDANDIIRFLSAGYFATDDAAARAEFKRLANELRKASGQPLQ